MTVGELKAEIADLRDKVSSRVRDVAIAMIAFAWSLAAPKEAGSSAAALAHNPIAAAPWLTAAIGSGSLALALDFCQYAVALQKDNAILRRQADGIKDTENVDVLASGAISALEGVATGLFWLKIVAAGFAFVSIAMAVSKSLLRAFAS